MGQIMRADLRRYQHSEIRPLCLYHVKGQRALLLVFQSETKGTVAGKCCVPMGGNLDNIMARCLLNLVPHPNQSFFVE